MTISIGIIGGTGSFGSGLALRLASIGYKVYIGSRSELKGKNKAQELLQSFPEQKFQIFGGSIADSLNSQVIVISTPPKQFESLLEDQKHKLDGKIVIDCAVSLKFGKNVLYNGETSNYNYVTALLPDSHVVSCFKTISAKKIGDFTQKLEQTDFVVTQSDQALVFMKKLHSRFGTQMVHLNSDVHAETIERITALLIQIGISVKSPEIGLKLVGL